MKYKSFETERLIIKPTSIEDAEFILGLMNTPSWIKFIRNRGINTVSESKVYIKNNMLPQFKKLGFGNYTVVRKSDNAKIGSCGLYDREGIEGFDIGFAFLPQYEGMGYAFESSNKLKELAITIFGIYKISAITTKGNTNSQKLLGKLGLHYIKVIRIPNDDEELLLYEYVI